MSAGYVFGYGSLVNTGTHDYAPSLRVSVRGWRRAWRRTDARRVSFLTVIPAPGVECLGLACGVPSSEWEALDVREAAYDRHVVDCDPAPDGPVVLYAIPMAQLHAPDDAHPILLSYLDVVAQGHLQQWGPDGWDMFLGTTDGWSAPILDDRDSPRYPRAQVLSPEERAAVDQALAGLGCRIIRP